MITKSDAIEIARRAIEGKANLQEGSPVMTESVGDCYVVTFVHINPPGVKGPDYDAKVTIEGKTGEVLRILGAS